MATPPFNIAESVPADDGPVSAYPAQERTFRDIVEDALAVEHDMNSAGSSARHKFGRGSTATRDAITDWVVGSLWINTSVSPARLETVVSVGPVVWEAISEAALFAKLASANTFSAANTFTALVRITSTAAGNVLELESTDAGAAAAPILDTYRNSASAAASDFLAQLAFAGNNSTPAKKVYAAFKPFIVTPTASSEDGAMIVTTLRAGADSNMIFDRGELRHTGQSQPGIEGAAAFKAAKLDGGFVRGASLHLREEQAAGTNGGGLTSGSFATRVLNVEALDEIGSTLSSNQFTLPAGTYDIFWRAPAKSVDDHISKLRNVTDSTDPVIGSVARAGSGAQTDSIGRGRFTIAATKTFAIQTRVTTTNGTDGGGSGPSFGVVNVFTEVWVWKVSP